MMEEFNLGQRWTDFTQANISGKTMTKVGSLVEWVAYVKAGYVVNSRLRPVRGRGDTYSLTMIAPELGRYVAMVRDEINEWDVSPEELEEWINNHADFFASRRHAQ